MQTSALDVAALAYAELRTLYGSELTIEHGEELSAYWRDAMRKLTVAELERGLALLAEQRGRAPNCSEFATLCRTGRRLAFTRTTPPASPRTSASPADVRTAERAIAEIKNRLGAQR